MSTITADPLFVRAELEYRREVWGTSPPAPRLPGPDVRGWLRRLVARSRRARAGRAHHGVAVHRPRRP